MYMYTEGNRIIQLYGRTQLEVNMHSQTGYIEVWQWLDLYEIVCLTLCL